jgi:glyoxylase I family protein
MAQLVLHHVNVIVTDLLQSLDFCQKLFGLTTIERPPFKNAGAWLACGALQVHLSLYPPGSFRTGNIDGADCHFAFRTDDFDGALATLTATGFREDAAEDDVSWSAAMAPPVSPSSSCSIPTATSSKSTARLSHARLTPDECASAPRNHRSSRRRSSS